ncbi:hypothetical protein APY94_05565 [Thermococcus celericrescens]|uniref:Uncharacterized protein n=1 Tax=Thermococcus celericrescens TaxID=227598 RepID=A0A117ITE5_9EURY|nr:transglutaminase-like domain-containing protein [Thermococcus celericrescens]KUH33662.1 hypothetical protein APY94_05565 [Thermococcus celericrescens]
MAISKYIIPDIANRLVANIKLNDKKGLQKLHRDLLKEICYIPTLKIKDSNELHPLNTIGQRCGNCLQISILEASILRGLGFSEREVYVFLLLHKGESVFEASHAVCGVFLEEKEICLENEIVILDPSTPQISSMTLLGLLLTHNIHTFFNDAIAFLVEMPINPF